MTLRLACLLAPGPQTIEHALLAEALGYDRVWLADSPALWQDIWARMALVAEHTHRVQLGTAVLIPSLRHVVTQAAACVDMTAKQLSFTGTASELRERLATMEAQGATEGMFGTMGADVPRELRAFAQLVGR
jgi:alkanesulfonate monooxygenase SsuD/methylene tetrahydromethanopterin reductase-like flavin-dependent oxidoreductase (luciferase family)